MKEQIIYELAFKAHVGLQQQIRWGEGIPERLAWKKFWGSKNSFHIVVRALKKENRVVCRNLAKLGWGLLWVEWSRKASLRRHVASTNGQTPVSWVSNRTSVSVC